MNKQLTRLGRWKKALENVAQTNTWRPYVNAFEDECGTLLVHKNR